MTDSNPVIDAETRKKQVQDKRDAVTLELNIDPETVERFDMYMYQPAFGDKLLIMNVPQNWGSVVTVPLNKSFFIKEHDHAYKIQYGQVGITVYKKSGMIDIRL